MYKYWPLSWFVKKWVYKSFFNDSRDRERQGETEVGRERQRKAGRDRERQGETQIGRKRWR